MNRNHVAWINNNSWQQLIKLSNSFGLSNTCTITGDYYDSAIFNDINGC